MEYVNHQHFCPACGFHLSFQPWDGESPADEICPCCYIQFGYDDTAGGNTERRGRIYARWREKWIAAGMPWRSHGCPVPKDWNPKEQVERFYTSDFPCPCCGYHTLDEQPPGTYEICPVCGWEDDYVQFHDPTFEGGANKESLHQARENFAKNNSRERK